MVTLFFRPKCIDTFAVNKNYSLLEILGQKWAKDMSGLHGEDSMELYDLHATINKSRKALLENVFDDLVHWE